MRPVLPSLAPRWLRRWLVGLVGAAAIAATAADPESAFDAANKLLAQGKAAEAAQAYGQIAADGLTSPALERNWGQASYQAGQPGPALAHLRRAVRLDPRDEAARADLAVLRTKAGNGTPVADDPLQFLRFLTLDEWAWLTLAAVWIWSALLGAARVSAGARAALRGFTFGGGVVAVLLGTALLAAVRQRAAEPELVVLAADTPVRQSPLDEAKAAFAVHAAAELRVRDAKDGWLMVEEPATQRFGWLKEGQVARVSP